MPAGGEPGRGPVARARAAVAAGLAHNAAGRPVAASARFRAALRHLDAAPDADAAYLRARALLGLVMSDFELRADPVAAARALDEAARRAREAGAPAVEVAVHGQRGLLHLRSGDREAALRELDLAAARREEAEPVDACRLLLNRGTLHLETGRLDRARQDLTECARRAAAVGNDTLLFKADHNLGYLEYLAGDLPRALALMADAERIEHGGSPAVSWLDRAQVLLEAGLVTEADTQLARAQEWFARHRLAHDLAEVELTRARCALVLDRPGDALALAGAARRRFARRGNAPRAAQAELTELRARLAGLGPDRRAAARVETAARTLVDRVPADLVRAAWLTVAEAALAAGRLAAAREAVAAAGRGTGPLTVQVLDRVVRARLAFAEGRTGAARSQVRAGQTLLAEHRRRLGSVEAVTAAAVHGRRLWDADVGAALAARDPVRVLDAVERGRATFAGTARVRPPDDPEQAAALTELRRCLETLRSAPAAERPGLESRAATLRIAIRERDWRRGDGVPAPASARAAQVRAAARSGTAVVDLVVHDGRVHAVVADPRLHLVTLAPVAEVEPVARRVRTDLDALAHPLPDPLHQVVARSLHRGLARLDELLLAPLGLLGPLHLVAGGALTTLPWGLLPTRRGLATAVATRVRPPGAPAPPPRRGVVALAGPGLAHAETEAGAVAAAWPEARVLGAGAAGAELVAALAAARVVHLAAHGRHEVDNPLFSWVRLADGPVFAHELDGLDLTGATVVLAACEVGRASVRPGGEALGLASVLLRLGASAVIAPLAPLRDDRAAAVMPALHRALAAGAGPAVALATLSHDPDPVPLACFADLGG